MPDPAISTLKKAARGLLYSSEKDAPFKTFAWDDGERLSKARVLELAGLPADSPVEITTLDDFFAHAVADQKWHAADEKAVVKRFRALVETIQEQLRSVKVYKVGTTKLRIYIVGKTKAGQWAGVETQALET